MPRALQSQSAELRNSSQSAAIGACENHGPIDAPDSGGVTAAIVRLFPLIGFKELGTNPPPHDAGLDRETAVLDGACLGVGKMGNAGCSGDPAAGFAATIAVPNALPLAPVVAVDIGVVEVGDAAAAPVPEVSALADNPLPDSERVKLKSLASSR